MDAPATTGDLLADAEAALHKLVTTGGIVRLRYGDKEIEYGPGNIMQLRQYIARLQGRTTTTIRVGTSKGLDR